MSLPQIMTPQFSPDLPVIVQGLKCPHCKNFLKNSAGIFAHPGSADGSANACPNYGRRFVIEGGVVTPA